MKEKDLRIFIDNNTIIGSYLLEQIDNGIRNDYFYCLRLKYYGDNKEFNFSEKIDLRLDLSKDELAVLYNDVASEEEALEKFKNFVALQKVFK